MQKNDFQAFMGGFLGGISYNAICYPFDTVKVRMQNSSTAAARMSPPGSAPQQYRSGLHCAVELFQKEGVRIFYRGVGGPMVGFGFAKGLEMEVLFKLRIAITESRGASRTDLSGQLQNRSNLSEIDNVLCSSIAAFFNTVAYQPFDTVKIRLQTQGSHPSRLYSGSIHCARVLYTEGGIPKLFLGLHAALLYNIPARVIQLGVYGNVRRVLPQEASTPHKKASLQNTLSTFVAGATAGVVGICITYPLDTMKTKFQSAKSGTYVNVLAAGRHLVREGGVSDLYLGIGPAGWRAVFTYGAFWIGMETTLLLWPRSSPT